MGWLFNNRIPENIKAEIERLCTFDDNTRSTRPLRVSRDGSIWTAAVEMTLRSGTEIPEDYRPDDNGRFVFGAPRLKKPVQDILYIRAALSKPDRHVKLEFPDFSHHAPLLGYIVATYRSHVNRPTPFSSGYSRAILRPCIVSAPFPMTTRSWTALRSRGS